MRLPAIVNWPAKIKPAVVNEPLHHVDIMPTVLALAGGKGDPTKPFDGLDATATILNGKPSPHDDILINVEAFRGAIRKGKWKLHQDRPDAREDRSVRPRERPGRKENVADRTPGGGERPRSATAGLCQATEDERVDEVQVDFLGFQGETALDPGYNIDHGLPTEKPVLPQK